MADPPSDDDAFAPPRSPPPHVVALEPEWERARADKQAAGAAARPPEPAPQRGSGAWIVAIALIVGAIGAGVWLVHHHREPARHARLPGIEIRVRADRPAEIRIDGQRAGKTPLTLQRRAGTTPIRIEATIGGTVQTRVVVPDRDQEIDFAP